ncbi:hypothetical protein ACQ4PT_062737 [Festuca glaucescens]
MEGWDLEEAEGKDESAAAGAETGDAVVHEEVVAVLKQADEGKLVENVRLMDRNLRYLPEAFGRIQGLRVLDVSHNQLQYAHLYQREISPIWTCTVEPILGSLEVWRCSSITVFIRILLCDLDAIEGRKR